MKKEVVTLGPDDTAMTAAKKFLKNNINSAPVVDNKKVIGFVSERDLVKLISEILETPIETIRHLPQVFSPHIGKEMDKLRKDFERAQRVKIKEIMTKKPITISPETSIEKIAEIICEKAVNHMPVVDENEKLIGMVAREDVIRAIAQS